MHKKILIAEQSDTTSNVAENVLRQLGYEVISISNGKEVMEELELSRPDLILVDSSLTVKGKTTLFESIQESPSISDIPFLLICDDDDDSSAYPDEVKVFRPIDPKELSLKVSVLAGSARSPRPGDAPGLLDEDDLGDDLLDAALGLDQLDVTDSEVMKNASSVKKEGTKGIEKMIGMEHDHENEIDDDSQGSRIESTRIDDEESQAGKHNKKSSKNPAKTGKIEILSEHDQFGLGNSELLERESEGGNHDYEWFIKEMKKDHTPGARPNQPKSTVTEAKAAKEIVPSAPPNSSKRKSGPGKPKSGSGGVEKFIEDFKKEVEKFIDPPHSTPIKSPKVVSGTIAQANDAQVLSGEFEKISIDQVEVFTRQFVNTLAEKVAEKIATKIDPQKLLTLIKNEIVSKSLKQ